MTNGADEPLDFWIDLARVGFEEDLHRLMERAKMNRAELARAAGVSAAFVSKVLNGSTNYTLQTMAKFARAVNGVLQVRLINEDNEVVRIVSAEAAAWLDDEGHTSIRRTADQSFTGDREVTADINSWRRLRARTEESASEAGNFLLRGGASG